MWEMDDVRFENTGGVGSEVLCGVVVCGDTRRGGISSC